MRLIVVIACLLSLGGAVAQAHPADVNDVDHDGTYNHEDNCPDAFNPKQSDIDQDAQYTFVPPAAPVNPTAPPPDTGGDACDIDDDADKVDDAADNCPKTGNADQADLDRDGKGDPCDGDDDADLVVDEDDNCPTVSNRAQADRDRDRLGDACDPDAPRATSAHLPGFDPNDKKPPRLRVRAPRRVRLADIGYGVTVRVTCSEACVLQGRLGRGRASAAIEGAGWTWLFVRPATATLRRVRGSGSATVSLRIAAQDGSGNRRTLRRRITIRR